MDNQEYEQKKQKCWEDFCRHIVDEEEELYNMFDFAYSLGKQKETVTQEEIEKEAEEYAEKEMENVSLWEWDSEYVQGLIEHAWHEGANFALGKQEKDADTVTINKGEYYKLCKCSRYMANWVPYFDVCPICGEYNQRGCVCANCNNDKNWNKGE